MSRRAVIAYVTAVGCAALVAAASCSDDPVVAGCEGPECTTPQGADASVDAPPTPTPTPDAAADGEPSDAGSEAAGEPLSVTVAPTSVTTLADASTMIDVTVSRAPGVAGAVDISVLGTGTTFKPVPLQIAAGESTGKLQIDVLGSAPSGKRSMSVVASLGALRATTPLDIDVTGLPGELDGAFGLGGKLKVYVDTIDSVRDMVLQPDGKILVGVLAGVAGAVIRVNNDGSLDTTFGTGGIVKTTHSVQGIRLQADGKIVIAGTAPAVSGHAAFAVARLMPSGKPDATFGVVDAGVPGTVYGNIDPKLERVNAMDLQTDGKILVGGQLINFVGTAYQNCFVARFETTGAVDTTFGNNAGHFRGDATCANFTKLVSQTGGILASTRRIVGGVPQPAIAKLTTGGAFDTSFGTSGFAALATGTTTGLAVLPTGELLAGLTGANITLYRFLATGMPDTSFATSGVATVMAGSIADLALYPSGKVAVVGTANSDFLTLRLTAAAALDTSFNVTGYRTTDIGGSTEFARSVLVTSTGAIVIGGSSGGHVALVRYLP